LILKKTILERSIDFEKIKSINSYRSTVDHKF